MRDSEHSHIPGALWASVPLQLPPRVSGPPQPGGRLLPATGPCSVTCAAGTRWARGWGFAPARTSSLVLMNPCVRSLSPTGRQRLPPGGRPGGSPEAPRLHRQAHVPENPEHPAAPQVTGKDPALSAAVPGFPTFGISPAKRTASSKHGSTGKSKAKQSTLPLPYISVSKNRNRPQTLFPRVLVGVRGPQCH